MSSLALSSEPAAPAAATVPGHIGLAVRDLGRSVPFYRDAFALTRWQRDGASGLHHLAFEAASAANVRAAETRLAPSCGFF
jgi:catechol 2,3-dioxygenase-like lactoylglutathione lyase family enzyme